MMEVSRDELQAHHCLEGVDRVSGDAETTAFKQRARLHQALWRERHGLPIGSQPMRPRADQTQRKLGSRIDLDFASQSGANFLNEAVKHVVETRLKNPQRHQTLNKSRLYCDLLSSMPMCFNLFGPLVEDLDLANRAVHAWWPDVPGRVRAVHLEWSPGRRITGRYLENRSAFDAAFELELADGGKGLLGIETKYHEHCKKEKSPSETRRKRYEDVARRSGAFTTDAIASILGTPLQQIWLDHLLALSMLQDCSDSWEWVGFMLVHPERNPSFPRAVSAYRQHLKDDASLRIITIEAMLATGVLTKMHETAFRDRYIW